MKLPNNWQQKTLEKLENNSWGNVTEASTNLIKRCIELTKIPLDRFTAGDLRIMKGQGFGLTYLIPLAIEMLKENIFIYADFYEGDLLNNVLAIETNFWNENEKYWLAMNALINTRRQEFSKYKIVTINFDKANFHNKKTNS